MEQHPLPLLLLPHLVRLGARARARASVWLRARARASVRARARVRVGAGGGWGSGKPGVPRALRPAVRREVEVWGGGRGPLARRTLALGQTPRVRGAAGLGLGLGLGLVLLQRGRGLGLGVGLGLVLLQPHRCQVLSPLLRLTLRLVEG
eukprot:scaffold33379_cov32-Phaeocystis_antarctica.AAC.1